MVKSKEIKFISCVSCTYLKDVTGNTGFLKAQVEQGTVQMRQRINTSETTTRHRSGTGTTRHAVARHK